MSYLQGQNRYQISYEINSLDEVVNENNEVRVVDAFVNTLNLKQLGFTVYEKNMPGQRPYAREDLLKLHIYGYLNGIRSSRKLEKEAHRNLEVMWLINSLTPDHGTISLFIKENKKAFREVLKQFTLILKGWGLVDGKLIAIDGTKIKAQNGRHNYITESKLNEKLKYAEAKIEEYLLKLEENDDADCSTADFTLNDIDELKNKIDSYQKLKDKYIEQKNDLKENNQKQKCITDPEARCMKNNGKFEVCYNVQTSVDSKNKLVVDCDVVNDINDLNQLSNMTLRTKRLLNKRKISVVADTGYYNATEIKKCTDDKVTLFIKKAKANNQTGENNYRKENFKYIAKTDSYICPEGKELNFAEFTTKNSVRYKRYKCVECANCVNANLCTTSKSGRNVQRWVHEEILEQVEKETLENNATYRQRQCIVEHPYGYIKRSLGYTYFLRKGLESVNAEAASIFVAYNLKRTINILTVPVLLEKLGRFAKANLA